MPKSKKTSLETTLAQLETILNTLEDEQLSLTESLGAFEIGLKLVREAQAELQSAEQRIVTLIEKSGNPVVSPSKDQTDE